ncbi:hypothetical protein CHS0354_004146 [Potamilus streckersoni]|uniref:b(0,+)-type amino acid transporter 1 n=1 Tax=Potamilus streckersoni TaxID=2493646 RepID=A0AAE0SZB8_9BIVA|nr:hypothetical protein CHS0354_004146 [Potamilus streckersoni]
MAERRHVHHGEMSDTVDGVDDEVRIDYKSTDQVRLKRNIGFISGSSFIVGSIIGSGIFISPKGVLREAQSVGFSMVVWAVGGLLSLLGALTYAELGTLIPKSGAEYPYLFEAMHPIVAYLFAWTKVVVTQPSSLAIVCLTFAEYVATFMDYCGSPQIPVKLIAALVILTICIINCYDTSLASSIQVIFTVAKLFALGIIVVGGIVRMAQGHLSVLQTGFKGTKSSPASVALAFYSAMWAYDLWNNLNYLTEELKNPFVNLPRANVFGILLVTVIYMLANISYFTVLTADELLKSDAVAVDWGKGVLGMAWFIIPISVLISTFGAANGVCFAGSRVVYCAAREGHLPEVLSYIHCKRFTPVLSIIFTCSIAMLMIIPSDVGGLIDFFSFASWIFYALTALALIILRFTRRNDHRPIKVFILIPVVFFLVSAFLVIAPIVQDPRIEILYALFFILGGLVLYFPFVCFKLDRGCFDCVTTVLQLICECAPSPYVPDDKEQSRDIIHPTQAT